MPNLATYEQKPPRVQALQWTGDPDDAAWIVEQYGGTMEYNEEAGQLEFTFPGEQPEPIAQGVWFVPDPALGMRRMSDEEFTATYEPVAASRS